MTPPLLPPAGGRQRAYGQDHRLTAVDRLGVWLSLRQVRRWVPSFRGQRVVDAGCGYHAALTRALLGQAEEVVALDVALDPELARLPRVTAVEGHLPDALRRVPDRWADVAICTSVLEHLWEPQATLDHLHRVLVPGGALLVNVPSWRGKRFLELSAFGLGLSPAAEIDDHKAYYDPRDLWPLLVRAGFAPRHVRCFRHKLGLNTFARCVRTASAGAPGREGPTTSRPRRSDPPPPCPPAAPRG